MMHVYASKYLELPSLRQCEQHRPDVIASACQVHGLTPVTCSVASNAASVIPDVALNGPRLWSAATVGDLLLTNQS